MHYRSVMIVEDELPAREMLRSFPWQKYGCVLAAEAENGEAALALMSTANPEIVITDVMMPFMDGISLIKALKEKHPNVHVILLTCYGDYHYVREALVLGAIDYLLKGIYREEELGTALKKVDELLKLKALTSNSAVIENRELWVNMGGQLNTYLFQGGDLTEDIQQLFPSRFIHMQWIGEDTDKIADQRKAYVQRQLENGALFPIIPFRNKEVLLFVPAMEELQFIQRIESDISQILPNVDEAAPVYTVIGKQLQSAENLKADYFQFMPIQLASFYDRCPSIQRVEQAHPVQALSYEDYLDLTIRMKETYSIEASFRAFIEEELDEFLTGKFIHPDDVKLLLVHWLAEWQRSGIPIESGIWKERILNAYRWERLRRELLQELEQARLTVSRELRIEIEQAMVLINKRLSENFTAVDIAEAVNLSPKYFGILFKKQTGEVFHDYVKRIRMEKAAHLLRTTSLKVYEVAEQVGFPNYRYFTDVFSKYFDKTPREMKGQAHAES
jgi:two-component system response regulator YesN